MQNVPPVTRNLLIINVIVYLFTMISSRLFNSDVMYELFGLFYPTSHYFHPWQYLTHLFMHGGFTHLFFNMFALYTFGNVVESTLGSRKMLWLYFLCGLGAVVLHLGVQALQVASLADQIAANSTSALSAYVRIKNTPTVGASGAIYGLMMAYALLYPQARLMLIFPPISLPAKTWVIIFAVIELFVGVRGVTDGVAHFAHLGGMLFGWLLIWWWRRKGTLFDRY